MIDDAGGENSRETSRERRNKSSFKLLKETFIVIHLEKGLGWARGGTRT